MAKKKAGKKQSANKRPAPAGKKKAKKTSASRPSGKVAVKSKPSKKSKPAAPKKKSAPKPAKKAATKGKARVVSVKKPAVKPVKAKKSAPPVRAASKPVAPVKQTITKPTAPSSNGLGVKMAPKQASIKAPDAPMVVVPAAKVQAVIAAPAPKPTPPPKPVKSQVQHVPKERVTMEFMVHSAPNVLYELISTPSGFSEWYCDDVNVRGDQFTFIWGNEEEATTLVGRKAPEVVRFHRNNDPDETTFFEFRIRIDAMTGEVALIVTDHAVAGEVEETRSLWASQIASLVRVLGA